MSRRSLGKGLREVLVHKSPPTPSDQATDFKWPQCWFLTACMELRDRLLATIALCSLDCGGTTEARPWLSQDWEQRSWGLAPPGAGLANLYAQGLLQQPTCCASLTPITWMCSQQLQCSAFWLHREAAALHSILGVHSAHVPVPPIAWGASAGRTVHGARSGESSRYECTSGAGVVGVTSVHLQRSVPNTCIPATLFPPQRVMGAGGPHDELLLV